MRRSAVLIALGPILLCISAAPSSRGITHDDGTLVEPPRQPRVEFSYSRHRGIVTELSDTAITIQRDAEKPQRFTFSVSLARGDGPTHPPPIVVPAPRHAIDPFDSIYHYRASDVRTGDHVEIQFSRVDGVDICDAICIFKRPGGRVPPAHGEESDASIKWHVLRNAIQDVEERGIPFPKEYEWAFPHTANELYAKHGVKRRVAVSQPAVAPQRIPPAID